MKRAIAWIRRRLGHVPERRVAAGNVDLVLDELGWRAVPPEVIEQLTEVEVCRRCGCTELRACPGGCWWVARGLCSRCYAGAT